MRTESTPAGHTPTLIACFLHFDVCFMLWVLVGALGVFIAESAGLDPAQKGLLVAIPVLTGSLLRVPLGILSDRLGGRRVGVALLAFLFAPLILGWLAGNGVSTLFLLGATLGVAGASFAVVLPLASRWYPPRRQGLVMGIAAAGNSGTVIANVFAPRLANVVGWHRVFGLAIAPLLLVLTLFALMARDSPYIRKLRNLREDVRVVGQADMWWFCLFYCVTFGGYVGLSSFLPLFMRDQFHVTAVVAGSLTALAALAGSVLRPLGGYAADRIGGLRLLQLLLLGIGLIYVAVAQLPALTPMVGLIIAAMACLGMGNGAVFQLVPQRFPVEIGMATGVIGAIGGVGGFLLPTLLGGLKRSTGSFGSGFVVLAVMAFAALLVLQTLTAFGSGWRSSWRLAPGPQAASEA
ncbi:MAG: NarK/NasA family nitrate transporter [Acidobacteria bacterium]|nr:NarK/NasA family nitrate transporter [Acidobacteriota bacterium]